MNLIQNLVLIFAIVVFSLFTTNILGVIIDNVLNKSPKTISVLKQLHISGKLIELVIWTPGINFVLLIFIALVYAIIATIWFAGTFKKDIDKMNDSLKRLD